MSRVPWYCSEPCWQHQISQYLLNGFCFYFRNRRKSPFSPVLNTPAYYVLYRSPIPALGLRTVVAISSILHGISWGWNNGAAAVLQECKKSKVGPLWTPYFYICSEKTSEQLHAVSALCSTEQTWIGRTWQRVGFRMFSFLATATLELDWILSPCLVGGCHGGNKPTDRMRETVWPGFRLH